MVLNISKKLILAFLGLTLVVLVSTLGLARWSFEQGFLDYVNALEEQRLRLLASDLSQVYLEAGGSWSTLTEQGFETILWQRWANNPEEQKRAGIPPPPGHMLPPPELRPSDPPAADSREQRPPHLGPPTAFYNTSGRVIAGTNQGVSDRGWSNGRRTAQRAKAALRLTPGNRVFQAAVDHQWFDRTGLTDPGCNCVIVADPGFARPNPSDDLGHIATVQR